MDDNLQEVKIDLCGIEISGLVRDGDTWNGFLKPYVTTAEIEKINAGLFAMDKNPAEYFQIDSLGNIWLIDTRYQPVSADKLDPIEISGKVYYYLAIGWTFSRAEAL